MTLDFEGLICEPPTIFNKTGTCTRGGYPAKVMEATSVADVQFAINFARNTGIRLVIKNTGHDFLGKSVGAGSLSVWTYKFQDIEFIASYETSTYSGSALKVGSGVSGYELYAFADDNGVAVLSGICTTVGVIGGYS